MQKSESPPLDCFCLLGQTSFNGPHLVVDVQAVNFYCYSLYKTYARRFCGGRGPAGLDKFIAGAMAGRDFGCLSCTFRPCPSPMHFPRANPISQPALVCPLPSSEVDDLTCAASGGDALSS